MGETMLGGWLASLPVATWPVALLALVFLAMLFGWIPTRRELNNTRQDGREWRENAFKQQEINSELKSILTELLSLARTTDHALREIQLLGRRAANEEARD